jgi:mono/diheme cytochrome c family protein
LPLSPRRFTRPLVLLPAALLGLVALTGCDDHYNESRIFPVRTDPVILSEKITEVGNLVGEMPDPDRPGQLPLRRLKNLDDRRNPFHLHLEEVSFGETGDKEKREKELQSRREQLRACFFDPADLSAEQRSDLETILKEAFGTPAHPKFNAEYANVKPKDVKTLRLDDETLKEGGRLYRLHCMQCHGLTGDGRGPTAQWVNPHPRDYRPGVYKFQSVEQLSDQGRQRPPRREDLFRTIYQGVEGTTMPAHNLLPDDQIEAMVSYVIFLSIRGQAELNALYRLAKKQGNIPEYLKGKVGGPQARSIKNITRDWVESQSEEHIIQVGPYKEPADREERRAWLQASAQRGFDLFQANCGTCHKDYGRQVDFKVDNAGWGILVRPANLTTGVYRGGRRAIDLYWRIHSGINGSGMAKLGDVMSADQIWDVVNFLQALPYPAMRQAYLKGN